MDHLVKLRRLLSKYTFKYSDTSADHIKSEDMMVHFHMSAVKYRAWCYRYIYIARINHYP